MAGFIKGAVGMAGLCVVVAGLIGCQDDAEDRAAQTARDALGVQEKDETSKTQTQRVLVKEEITVIDPKTGKALSEQTKVTPVTVERKVKTDVDVNVGETQTTPSPEPRPR